MLANGSTGPDRKNCACSQPSLPKTPDLAHLAEPPTQGRIRLNALVDNPTHKLDLFAASRLCFCFVFGWGTRMCFVSHKVTRDTRDTYFDNASKSVLQIYSPFTQKKNVNWLFKQNWRTYVGDLSPWDVICLVCCAESRVKWDWVFEATHPSTHRSCFVWTPHSHQPFPDCVLFRLSSLTAFLCPLVAGWRPSSVLQKERQWEVLRQKETSRHHLVSLSKTQNIGLPAGCYSPLFKLQLLKEDWLQKLAISKFWNVYCVSQFSWVSCNWCTFCFPFSSILLWNQTQIHLNNKVSLKIGDEL